MMCWYWIWSTNQTLGVRIHANVSMSFLLTVAGAITCYLQASWKSWLVLGCWLPYRSVGCMSKLSCKFSFGWRFIVRVRVDDQYDVFMSVFELKRNFSCRSDTRNYWNDYRRLLRVGNWTQTTEPHKEILVANYISAFCGFGVSLP